MTKLLGTMGLAAALVLGCGGSTSDAGTGGAAGSAGAAAGGGSGGTGGTGGTGGMPPECTVPASGPGPYATRFEVFSNAPQPLFIREQCELDWSLRSCADGYQRELPHEAGCTTDCSDSDPGHGCILCSPCRPSVREVRVGQSQSIDWAGSTFEFGTSAAGCACHEASVAPAGEYEIQIPVFATEADARESAKPPLFVAKTMFALPAPTGVVRVELVMSED